MAGYLKLWTTLRTNRTFLSLKINARGMYLQLLLACKDQRDDGQVWYKNVAELSQSCSCDARTTVKLLQALSINAAEMLITYNINADGTVVIDIPNYIRWQQLDVKEVQQKRRKGATKLQPTRPDQTRLEQTRPEKSNFPAQKIMNLFNEICTSLPEIKSIEGARLKTMQSRWKQQPNLDWWNRFFVTVQASDFLAGRTPPTEGHENWRCDFDFIMKPRYFTKIIEGGYQNREAQGELLSPEAIATARNAKIAGEMIRREEAAKNAKQ